MDRKLDRVLQTALRRVLCILLSRGTSQADAEDAVQDAAVRLLEHGPLGELGDDEDAITAWMAAVGRHRLCDMHRHDAVLARAAQCGVLERTGRSGVDVGAEAVTSVSLELAWSGLEADDRAVLQLVRRGCSVAEIAAHLGLNREQAKKRLQRARSRYRKRLIAVGLDSFFAAERHWIRNGARPQRRAS